ncbi:MAG: transcriptional repressor [Deltaproteobacteria bacterium]|nr:transcriptional repressor [Deltaproteobacteria bacterium]
MNRLAEDDPREILKTYVSRHGLKFTRQRELIADVFFNSQGHLRVEDLLESVRAIDPQVSLATVYRTMKLLTECGLASPHRFGDGHTRYEPAETKEEHHDHLICTACGRIVEFLNEEIEELQHRVAAENGFVVTNHRMELYGLCKRCHGQLDQ